MKRLLDVAVKGLLVVSVAVLSGMAVQAQPPPAGGGIVGTWLVRTPDSEIVFEARADGRYTRLMVAGNHREEDGGTYRFADGKLHLQPRDDEPLTLNCRLTEDGQLEVTDDEGDGFRLIRQTPPAAPASGTQPAPGPQDYVTVKEARWSPRYDRLVFSSDWMQARSVCVQDIFIAHADGSGIYRVTGNEARGPAPGGYGSVRGVIVDNLAKDGGPQLLEPTRLQICVAGQGGDGTIRHPSDPHTADVLNPDTREKTREQRAWKFHLPRVAASGQSWVRVWRDKHKGNVVFVPIRANAENDVGVVELDVGNYSAGNGNVTPDGRYVVGMGALGGATAVCVYDGASGPLLHSWSTPVGTTAKEPALSPDGTQVAVCWGEMFMENLAVVSLADLLAGRPNPRVLVPGERVFPSAATGFMAGQISSGTPAWSPDGRMLAFYRGLFATQVITGNLWVINADGSGLRQLTNFGPECLVIQPCFFPDGRSVAFAVLTGKDGPMRPEQFVTAQFTGDIYSIGIDGSGLRRLTNDGVSGEPAWGP